MNNKICSGLVGWLAFMLSGWVYAKPIQGIGFSHHDWELACSNTGTCQAAGYQEADGEQPVSILLTRQAGANQRVQGQITLGDDEERYDPEALTNLQFYVNGKSYGVLQGDFNKSSVLALTQAQVNALLQHSKSDAEIIIKNKHNQWQVSDKGMTAVLLKMDDFQGRVGTVGALVQKGPKDESKVLAAQAKIVVKQVKTAKDPSIVLKKGQPGYDTMLVRLMGGSSIDAGGRCSERYWQDEPREIQIYHLADQQQLAMMMCWRGAYNMGIGAWLLDDRAGINKTELITDQASEFNQGEIYASHKGRGMGDCWVSYQWIWDGHQFVQTINRWTGMCKMVATGGAWELNKIEAVVK